MIRENVNSLKNIKSNLYSVKKDSDSLSIDLKKLKEEHINKSNKRVKVRSIIINNKVNCFNRKLDRFNKRFNLFINKTSSKINACAIKGSAIVKNNIDVCTSTDDLIVINNIDVCTSTNDLIVKNQVDACTSTGDLIVKNNIDVCTSTDDLIVKNQVDACTEIDTLNNEPCDNDNEPVDNKYIDNEACDNEPIDNKEKSNNQKLIDQVNMVFEARKGFLNNIDKMSILKDDLQDEIFSDDPQLMLFELNQINKLADESLDYIWNMLYGKNIEKDEITDINIDKNKDIDGYMSKDIKIINDKSEVINKLGELLDSIVNELQNVIGIDNYDSILRNEE